MVAMPKQLWITSGALLFSWTIATAEPQATRPVDVAIADASRGSARSMAPSVKYFSRADIQVLLADPAIRAYTGLSENAWDFNAPNSPHGFGPADAAKR